MNMEDLEAAPENVHGQVVQKHVFEHHVNWGYVAIGVAVAAFAYLLYQASRDEDEKS